MMLHKGIKPFLEVSQEIGVGSQLPMCMASKDIELTLLMKDSRYNLFLFAVILLYLKKGAEYSRAGNDEIRRQITRLYISSHNGAASCSNVHTEKTSLASYII